MEMNTCDVNHLESEVLLPPRKRLLAGFKKQNSDAKGSSNPPKIASSSRVSPSSDVQTHLNNLLASRMNNPNLMPEEIAKASRSAAIAAVNAAKTARLAADEKAAIAAKAVVAARRALDLVAAFPGEAACKERCLKKNQKLKKQVSVEVLYTKEDRPRENHRGDEELARKLHRAINSSPRILRTCSGSEGKRRKHKKLKGLVTYENPSFSNGIMRSMCDGLAVAVELNSDSDKADENEPVYENSVQLELIDNMEAESSHSKDKTAEEFNSNGKRRGRVKLKKLPLGICSSKDQMNPYEEWITKPLDNLRNENTKPLIRPEGFF